METCNCQKVKELEKKVTELQGIIIRLQCDLDYYKAMQEERSNRGKK